METAHKAEETKKKVQSLREDFIAKAKEKGVKNESWLKDYAEEITIGEDFDVMDYHFNKLSYIHH